MKGKDKLMEGEVHYLKDDKDTPSNFYYFLSFYLPYVGISMFFPSPAKIQYLQILTAFSGYIYVVFIKKNRKYV